MEVKGVNEPSQFVEWPEGNGESVQFGYYNRNGQQCCGHCGVKGTDHGQYAYKTECSICEFVNRANGSDMHERKCPECQGGKPCIKYWKEVPQQ